MVPHEVSAEAEARPTGSGGADPKSIPVYGVNPVSVPLAEISD